ncbi:unnamed protein product [Sphagnum troendelagicum]|uniref:Uncharacterized protein n=1 Tax=Sphagnum troendelagicum TaxID=128251 RepID=A0ABP0TFZ6_9BRYO
MAGSISRMLRVALNRHPLQTRAQCSSVAWLLPFRHWSQYHSPLHNNAPRRTPGAQFHGKTWNCTCPSSSLVGQPLGRGQGRYPPRMLPRALQSPPSAPPTNVWRRDCLLYDSTGPVVVWPG